MLCATNTVVVCGGVGEFNDRKKRVGDIGQTLSRKRRARKRKTGGGEGGTKE
jgi:hypothetical protein